MILIGVLNFLTGLYLVQDTLIRFNENVKVLYFDGYFLGFARYIPLATGILMIISGLGIIVFRRSGYVILSYLLNFVFILFYTPTAFFLGNERDDIRFLLPLELFMALISIVVLYSGYEKGANPRKNANTRITYEDYRRSMNKFRASEDRENEEENQ